MIRQLERVIFYILVFSISFQVGKHFWPQFSFVHGIRVDYLSPTFYLIDLLIILLFLLFFVRLIISHKMRLFFSVFFTRMFLFFFLFLVFSLLISTVFLPALYGLGRIVEFLLFSVYVAKNFQKRDISLFVFTLSLSATISAFMAIAQFLLQHSLGGSFYFLGERTFQASSIGVAVFQTSFGLLLRPYAAFSHPNILAFFLLFSIVFITMRLLDSLNLIHRYYYLTVLGIISIAFILTFSRGVLFCFVLYFGYFFFHFRAHVLVRRIIAASFISLLFFFILFGQRFFGGSFLHDATGRLALDLMGFQIFMQHPLFGGGLNYYFYAEGAMQHSFNSYYLQPIHSIYLLVLIQLGIVGFVVFLMFLIKTYRRVLSFYCQKSNIKYFYRTLFFLLTTALFIGFFDHYFLTIEQGQLLFSLLLGLCWTKI